MTGRQALFAASCRCECAPKRSCTPCGTLEEREGLGECEGSLRHSPRAARPSGPHADRAPPGPAGPSPSKSGEGRAADTDRAGEPGQAAGITLPPPGPPSHPPTRPANPTRSATPTPTHPPTRPTPHPPTRPAQAVGFFGLSLVRRPSLCGKPSAWIQSAAALPSGRRAT